MLWEGRGSNEMKAWIKRLASKSFLLCLPPLLLLLIVLQHSVQRFPLTSETVVEGKGEQEIRTKSAISIKNYLKPSNILSKKTTKVFDIGKHYHTTYTARQQNHVEVKPTDSSFGFNNSNQNGDKTRTEPQVVTPVPTEGSITPDTWREPHRKVLVLSSVGRSGSSFLGLLLAALGNNMYFFEPIRGLSGKDRNKTNNMEELMKYFHCKVRKSFLRSMHRADINVIHPYTRNKTREQVTVKGVEKHCRQEPLIIVKTIRLRLEWVREVMRQKEFENLKVIHLVRDPRGSFTSIEKLKWKITDVEVCEDIYQDLQEKETMMSLYPSRYIFIKYEDLCRDPYGETKRLLQFLNDHGEEEPDVGSKTGVITDPSVDEDKNRTRKEPAVSQDLPKGICDFLDNHLHVQDGKRLGPFTTARETKSMYQRWRWYITGRQLESLEAACGEVICALGHRMFSTFAAVRNSSLSLFDDKLS